MICLVSLILVFKSYKLEKDQELAMVEGALHFFTMLLSVRTYLGKFL